jgi:hypothetical protein
MFPPHLPAPSSSINKHRKFGRLKILLVATCFGLIAGVSGAAVMLGWIWPSIDSADNWVISRYSSTLPRRQLEQRVRSDTLQKIFVIYSKPTNFADFSYLKRQDKLGEAVVVSSEGWLAMHTDQNSKATSNWRAVSFTGVVYSIDQSILDQKAQVLYLHLKQQEGQNGVGTTRFEVVNFDELTEIDSDIFVYHSGSWVPSIIVNNHIQFGALQQLDSAPRQRVMVRDVFEKGEVVVNTEGRVIGVMSSSQSFIPAAAITRVVPLVLSTGKISYPSLGVSGWYNFEQPIVVNGNQQPGFLVTAVNANNTLFKRGDIIVKLNGQPLTPDLIWNYRTADETRVDILRRGKSQEILVPLIEL